MRWELQGGGVPSGQAREHLVTPSHLALPLLPQPPGQGFGPGVLFCVSLPGFVLVKQWLDFRLGVQHAGQAGSPWRFHSFQASLVPELRFTKM